MPTECLKAPQQYAQLDPTGPRSFVKAHEAYTRGQTLMEAGQTGQAQAAFTQAVQADPSHGLARIALAETHWLTDNNAPLIREHLAAAALLLPQNPRAHLRFADINAELDEGEVAARHYRCALTLSPDLTAAHVRLAKHALGASQAAEAERHIRAAIAAEPKQYLHLVLLGQALRAQGRPQDAAKALEGAAVLKGTSAPLYRRAARLYEDAQAPKDALRMKRIADDLDPPKKTRSLRPLRKARPRKKRKRRQRRR